MEAVDWEGYTTSTYAKYITVSASTAAPAAALRANARFRETASIPAYGQQQQRSFVRDTFK